MKTAALVLVALTCCAAETSASGRAVALPSIDGTNLAGAIYEASSRPAPGVVLVHMQSRDKSDWEEFANQLQDAGLTALAIDLRGHGGSSGSRENVQNMVLDVKAAVQWLSARQGVRPGDIGVVGASLGANLSLLAAAADVSLVKAVGLLSPSLDYRGLRIDASVLRKTGGLAMWMAAGTKDPFSLRTLKDLTAAASGAREQRLAEGAAHGMSLLADPEISRALVDWLRRSLLS